ncbi:MAG: cation-transporting P-type ATPase [Microthrixaceae bacterium]|nr:cation-transporting P-type ATPase [Microthrixaceae bacterium]
MHEPERASGAVITDLASQDSILDSATVATMSSVDVATALGVDPLEGLDASEVSRRTEAFGANQLAEAEPDPAWKRLLAQFRNVLTYVLLGAAVISAAVGDIQDPIVILVVLLINGVFGFIQENRADAAMEALSEMLELVVRVRRDGALREVPASELVPGDVVLLEAGDRVPADGRFVVTNNLGIEESALTGESVPPTSTPPRCPQRRSSRSGTGTTAGS